MAMMMVAQIKEARDTRRKFFRLNCCHRLSDFIRSWWFIGKVHSLIGASTVKKQSEPGEIVFTIFFTYKHFNPILHKVIQSLPCQKNPKNYHIIECKLANFHNIISSKYDTTSRLVNLIAKRGTSLTISLRRKDHGDGINRSKKTLIKE